MLTLQPIKELKERKKNRRMRGMYKIAVIPGRWDRA